MYKYATVQDEIEWELVGEAITDLWTSGLSDLQTSGLPGPYITFTVYYTDSTLQLQGDHTGENIKEVLLETLSECNLKATNLVAITTHSDFNVNP